MLRNREKIAEIWDTDLQFYSRLNTSRKRFLFGALKPLGWGGGQTVLMDINAKVQVYRIYLSTVLLDIVLLLLLGLLCG